jgi:hypothetical protein
MTVRESKISSPRCQVEFDLVAVDVEERGTGLRFVARQYGHGCHAA